MDLTQPEMIKKQPIAFHANQSVNCPFVHQYLSLMEDKQKILKQHTNPNAIYYFREFWEKMR